MRDEPEADGGDGGGGRDDTESTVCPVCGAALVHEKCKVVCRSATCIYRIVFNCAEF